MSDGDLMREFGDLVTFSFVSTLVIGFALIGLAIIQDFIIFQIHAIAQTFEASGLIGSWVVPVIEGADQVILFFPSILDLVWLASFLLMVFAVGRASYFSRREGYFSSISLLLYGTFILLYLSSIFLTLSTWFNEEILASILPTFSLQAPIYTYYIANAGVINLLVIVVCLILNMVDFDLLSFSQRKEKENIVKEEAL